MVLSLLAVEVLRGCFAIAFRCGIWHDFSMSRQLLGFVKTDKWTAKYLDGVLSAKPYEDGMIVKMLFGGKTANSKALSEVFLEQRQMDMLREESGRFFLD